MWPDRATTHATGCPHSPSGVATESSPQGPPLKHVWFNLTCDLGEAPQQPTNMASFLDGKKILQMEWIDAQCSPAPFATSSPRPPRDDSDQWHATPAGVV